MTDEEEIEIVIAKSIINEHIAKLSRRWSVERACGNSEGSEKVKKAIWNARAVLYNLTPEEARRVIEDSKMFNLGTYTPKQIRMASTDLVEEFRPEVDEILLILGHPEALVTDLSTLGDFLPDADCEVAKSLLGFLERVFEEQQMLDLRDTLVSWARAIRGEFDGRR